MDEPTDLTKSEDEMPSPEMLAHTMKHAAGGGAMGRRRPVTRSEDAPCCPEHGEQMRYDLQPNWWACRRCWVRVFPEDGLPRVPSVTIGLRSRRYMVWHRMAA